jgi:hypothetical protein
MYLPKKRWPIVLLLLTALPVGGFLYHQWKFPYGWSHSCDKCLMFALHQYADEHGGAYPAGEATPEASLSLLYPKYGVDAEILRGKTVPREVVQAILDRGDRLGPDTCGWHYVEGLRLDEDPRVALCWDKVGLGHNGERLSAGGHMVLFVKHGYEYVSGSKWQEFVDEQEKLLAELNRGK